MIQIGHYCKHHIEASVATQHDSRTARIINGEIVTDSESDIDYASHYDLESLKKIIYKRRKSIKRQFQRRKAKAIN